MKRRWMVCLCLLWALGGLSRADEIWLRYRVSASTEREIVNMGSQNMELSQTLPVDWSAPEGAFNPVGATLKMGVDDQFKLLFTANKKDGKRDKLWVSRDGDWARAATYAATTSSEDRGPNSSSFVPVLLKLKMPDGEVDYHAQIQLYSYDKGKRLSLNVGTACYYQDRIELEGKTHRVALVDANGNGRFDDSGATLRQCDWLMIDTNDDGRLDAYADEYKDVFPVGKYIKFGEKLYSLKVAPDGAFFSIEPANCPTGKIRIQSDATDYKATFFGENGRLILDGKAGETTAPCGKYRIVSATFYEPGKDRESAWQLSSRSMSDLATSITVTADKTAEIKIGPPLTAALQMEKTGAQHAINLKLTGQAGEEYTIDRSRGRNNPPKLEIKRAGSNEPPRTLSFEYG
ncbi:MAG: hypothetical protein ABFD69_06995 [Candidatus Sumerlaeia bacterium]